MSQDTGRHIAKPHEMLWLYSMGKRFMVRAIFTSDQEANEYMSRNRDTALIAEFGPFRIIANQYAGVPAHSDDEVPA